MGQKPKLRLLLVDDDATDRELFIDAISMIGKNYEVSESSDGEEALHYLTTCEMLPHLVILDLNMPVKDGRATLKEIKSHSILKSIPVCIMSTSSAHFDVENAYSNGANLFLVKPFEFKELLEMLNSLLNLFHKYVTLLDESMLVTHRPK
jgi:two-component system, chemotaxis family, response regulator Rcp1